MRRSKSLYGIADLRKKERRPLKASMDVPTAGVASPPERVDVRLSGHLPGSTTAAHEPELAYLKSLKKNVDTTPCQAFGGDLSLLNAAGWSRPTLSSSAVVRRAPAPLLQCSEWSRHLARLHRPSHTAGVVGQRCPPPMGVAMGLFPAGVTQEKQRWKSPNSARDRCSACTLHRTP